MTQTLDVRERISGTSPAHATAAPKSVAATKFGTFAITFGIAFATLYTVIDGKIARITTFHSEREALEAAGLSG